MIQIFFFFFFFFAAKIAVGASQLSCVFAFGFDSTTPTLAPVVSASCIVGNAQIVAGQNLFIYDGFGVDVAFYSSDPSDNQLVIASNLYALAYNWSDVWNAYDNFDQIPNVFTPLGSVYTNRAIAALAGSISLKRGRSSFHIIEYNL